MKMDKIKIFIICLLLSSFIEVRAQERKSHTAENGSLRDTLTFISQMLTEYYNPTYNKAGDDFKSFVSGELKYNGGCEGIKYIETSRSAKTGQTHLTYKFSLSDMDPKMITLDLADSRSRPNSSSPEVILKINTLYHAENVLVGDSEVDSSVSFPFIDLEIAEQVKNAFIHAINLCSVR